VPPGALQPPVRGRAARRGEVVGAAVHGGAPGAAGCRWMGPRPPRRAARAARAARGGRDDGRVLAAKEVGRRGDCGGGGGRAARVEEALGHARIVGARGAT
jgi:hypothetical protein